MTWHEFQLRRDGYFREQRRADERMRFQTYYTLVAGGMIDDRKMSKEQFMPLEGDKRKAKGSQLSNEQREWLKMEQNKAINGG